MTEASETPETPDPSPPATDANATPRVVPEPPSVRAAEDLRSKRMLLLVVRLLFLVMLVTVTLLTVASTANRPEEFEFTTLLGLFIGSTAVGVIVLLLDSITPNKRLSSVVGVYLGICVGLIGALAIGALVDVVAEAWELTSGPISLYLGLGKFVVALVLCYLAVSVVFTTKDDFRLVIPYVEFAKQVRGIRPLLLDTSVLIDGRVESIAQTGFLDAPLVLPQFVIDELQALSDSSDKLKRGRGRRGLTVVSKLQESPYVDMSIESAESVGHSVDHKLLHLASQEKLRILTNDYNLNKVAQIQGVTVLNINDLANTLKSQAIPGETLVVDVVKPGEGPGQGVGYMPDGTIVVIENAGELVGEPVTLTVTNSLQTSAGRMIFGKVVDDESESAVQQVRQAATRQPRYTGSPEPSRQGSSRGSRSPRRN